MTRSLAARRCNLRNVQLLGTGLWDDPRIFANPALQGGLFAAPDPAGFRGFAGTLSRPIRRRAGAHRDAGL